MAWLRLIGAYEGIHGEEQGVDVGWPGWPGYVRFVRSRRFRTASLEFHGDCVDLDATPNSAWQHFVPHLEESKGAISGEDRHPARPTGLYAFRIYL